MLAKLIKHEFKRSAHAMKLSYAALLVIGVLIFLMWLSDVDSAGGIFAAFLVAGALATLALSYYSAVTSYTKYLYGDSATVMLTLPCDRSKTLFSRFFVSYIWVLAAQAAVILSLFAVRLYAHGTLGANIVAYIDGMFIFKDFSPAFILFMVFALLVIPAYLICSVYFSVSFSHIASFAKHRSTVATAVFFVLNLLVLSAGAILTLKVPCSVQPTVGGISFTAPDLAAHIAGHTTLDKAYVGVLGAVFLLVVAVVIYCVTKSFLRRKTAI